MEIFKPMELLHLMLFDACNTYMQLLVYLSQSSLRTAHMLHVGRIQTVYQ